MLDIWLFDFPKKQSPIPPKWHDFIFGNVFGRMQDVPGWEVLRRMRKKNFKGRCEKRMIGKCAEVCRTYDAIQYAYADLLQMDEEVKEIRCNVLLDGWMSESILPILCVPKQTVI